MKKKLLALVLSAVMVMGISTTAFAATQNSDGTWKDDETITITKSYELSGKGVSPAETFEVKQVGNGTVADGDAASAPDLVSISSISYEDGAAGSEEKTGTFTVTLPTYTNTGVYEYTLQETAGKTAGVTYRTDTMKLVVTVIEQDGLVRVAAVHTEDEDGEKSDSFDDNTYTANSLTVSKTVAGNMGDKTKEFNFSVEFTAPEDVDWTNAITIADGSGASNLSWNGNTATFTLSDGDSVEFENVPAGVTYTVKEDDYSSDGYVTTKNGDEGTMDQDAKTAAFTNTKDSDVDTGINLDSLPYIMVLVILAGAAAVFFATKKRRVK